MNAARTSLLARALLLLGFAGVVHAADPARPGAAQRLVNEWNFEERDRHAEPIPIGWFRGQDLPPARARPGFPRWNEAELSEESAHSGRFSVKLPTRGGSTSLRLSSAMVPALPGADYLIAAAARTANLSFASASLSAWFLDERLNPIEGTRVVSPPVRSPVWTEVAVPLLGRADATWIQVELNLLQPAEAPHAGVQEPHAVHGQDYSGAVFFDDLSIRQMPRIEVRPLGLANVITAPDPPRLTLLLRDLTGEKLTTRVRLYDDSGREAGERSFPTASRNEPFEFEPAVDAFGWWRAVLTVSNETGPIAAAWTDFLYLPRLAIAPPGTDGLFALAARRTPLERLGDTATLASRTDADGMHLPVWHSDLTREALGPAFAGIRGAAERLTDERREVTFVLADAPAELVAASGGAEHPLDLLAQGDGAWREYLSPIVVAFGERVRRWQLGDEPPPGPPTDDSALGKASAAREALRQHVPRPSIQLPWDATHVLPDSGPPGDGLVLRLPSALPPEAFSTIARTFEVAEDLTVHIELPDADRFGRRAAVIELVRRTVAAWQAGWTRLVIDEPWSLREGRDAQILPRPELAAWRTLAAHLKGRRIVGELPVSEGARAFIAQGQSDSLLIAWNESAEPRDAQLRGYLGHDRIEVTDVFGNQASAGDDRSGMIQLTEWPLFIRGVDPELARFRSALRAEPAFVQARAERHRIEVVMENPWSVTVQGRFRIAEPMQWNINPRVSTFSIPPGGSVRLPIDLAFGLGQEAGAHTLMSEIELTADRRYPVLRLPLRVELGLDTVQLMASYVASPPGPAGERDLIVTLVATNLGDKPVTLEAFAQAPGFPAFSAPISAIEPGASAVRRFRLENGAERLRSRSVRVGLRESDGTGRINRTLTIQ